MKLKKLILSALFAALCCIVTMALPIPTPTGGYLNVGDSLVISAGIFLGPLYGGLAAGIGSMLSDLFLGYLVYVPATFTIKFLAAFAVALVYKFLTTKQMFSAPSDTSIHTLSKKQLALPILCGIVSSLIVVLGYFLFEWLLTDNLLAGAISGITGNFLQGLASTILAAFLYPILKQILHNLNYQ